MTTTRTALITGANQGLGFALAAGLAQRWTPDDRVILTGRSAERVRDAAASLQSAAGAAVEGRVLDVRDGAATEALAAELTTVDVVFSNATARSTPDQAPASIVDENADVSNFATTRILRAFAPRLRPGGRLIVVASSFGTLGHLDPKARPLVATAAEESMDAVDALVDRWRQSVLDGTAAEEGWGEWLNIPSKVLQVAAVRALARVRRAQDLAEGTLVASVCPGLIDTHASRPWFDDMRDAQSPRQAAQALLDLVSGPLDPAQYGELVRFGEVLDWTGATAARAGAGIDANRIA